LWQGPRWTLAIMLAALGTLGPFSIDTYLPAFDGIAASLDATPLQMQQTLSAYLFGFSFMQLFHGALADSFGRRKVVLWGVVVFTITSVGCALAHDIHLLIFWRAVQGMSTGAGLVVSRAVIRDMFPPTEAQKMMSQVTLFFGVAPAVAPMMGGVLFATLGWHSIFWLLVLIGVALMLSIWRLLPETLAVEDRQPFNVRNLMRGYREVGADPRFLLLSLASGVPFNGFFLYVLAAPTFLGKHLGMAPTQFFWLFCTTIGGIMLGAFISGRLAGNLPPVRQVRRGFRVMVTVSLIGLAYALFATPSLPWVFVPICLYALGWALMQPSVTLMVLDLFPARRGMASSLQGCIGSASNGIVAGIIAPIAMTSLAGLAIASTLLLAVGLVAWLLFKRFDTVASTLEP
jgi:DHA1 family bicyclomycin/chloramphenicol resistance-like MFS transporter